MEIVGKIVLMPKGDYDPNKTYEHLDWVRYNGSSWVCKQDNTIGVTPSEGTIWTCLAENGADGQDGQAGDSLTATHSKSGTTTTVVIENATTGAVIDTFDIEDGASGSGTGDMVSSDFVGSGATTSVWKAEHLVKSDGSLISGDDVGSDYIDSVSSDFDVVGKELQLSSGVTAKLSELDNTTTDKDKVLTANGDGTARWEESQGGGTAKDIAYDNTKSGLVGADVQDAIDELAENSSIVPATLLANTNSITITSQYFKDDSALYVPLFEPTEQNDDGTYKVLTCAKEVVDTTNGAITIETVETPTVNTRVAIQITKF